MEKRSTIGDVARHAGVSAATVSRIVNGVFDKASPETVARVQAAVEELKYRPGSIGRALRKQESRLVPFLVPDVSNAFYAAIAVSVETALRERDCAMILCNTAEAPDVQDAYLTEMQSHLVPGIVMMGAVASPGLERIVEAGEPLIFINRRSPFDGPQPFVGIDNYAAGQDIADHLASRGVKACAVISGPASSSASRDRLNGFLDGMRRHGVSLDENRIAGAGLTTVDGYEAATRILADDPLPQAIFCVNDLAAYGAYKRCRELGLEVPGDVILFGIDDNPLNEWIAPWLSTVHIPAEEIGKAVGDMFVRIWDGASIAEIEDVLLLHQLVLRS